MKKSIIIILLFLCSVTSGISMTSAGLRLLKSFEGCSLVAYKCPAGVWTISWGITKGVYPGMRITEVQAEEMLLDYLRPMEIKIRNKVGRSLPWYQEDALECFVFNLGIGVLKAGLLEDIKQDSPNVGKRMLGYDKARDPKTGLLKPLKGLTKRRVAEVTLYEKRVFNGRK